MLEQVLAVLHNWFVVPGGMHPGTYEISSSGSITLPFLANGQYFRIVGSVFNDGVYRYDDRCRLVPETFTGSVWALAIPKGVLNIVCDIQEWQDKYADAVNSPFQSESFGGYSYTKSSANSAQNDTETGWKSVFASRLKEWRKI